ncbi:MAG: ribbon-helix-helix domain-containing protein [Nanoarchaeota archaeon]
MLEAISLKLDKGLLKDIDENLKKHRYSTRTEFIRDAIRHELSNTEKEEMLKALHQLKGIFKRKTTDEELHAVREKLAKEWEKKFK